MTVGMKNVRGRMVTEYPAGGTPKGLTIYFLWSYSRKDRSDYRDFLKPVWNIIRTRYIGLLTGKGYKVLSVWRATREDMMVAHHNPRSAGVYIDAHGSAGKVRSSDGKWFAVFAGWVEGSVENRNLCT